MLSLGSVIWSSSLADVICWLLNFVKQKQKIELLTFQQHCFLPISSCPGIDLHLFYWSYYILSEWSMFLLTLAVAILWHCATWQACIWARLSKQSSSAETTAEADHWRHCWLQSARTSWRCTQVVGVWRSSEKWFWVNRLHLHVKMKGKNHVNF